MTVTPTEFKLITWRPDKSVLNPNINPEVDFFSIDANEYISFQPMMASEKGIPIAFAGLKWIYTIENKKTSKEVLYYEADDTFTLSMGDMSNEKADMTKAVKDSFMRFSDYFDKNRVELGIKQKCQQISESEAGQIAASLLSMLKR